jgi:2,4-dienoyl-CoA reductase-like NADH-dependent reductase (Old Yellow Enzyme family)
LPNIEIPTGPNYQVPFAQAIRGQARMATGAVGMITEAAQANDIVASGSADAVLVARAMLGDPNWTLHAARSLGIDVPWPVQFERAKMPLPST